MDNRGSGEGACIIGKEKDICEIYLKALMW